MGFLSSLAVGALDSAANVGLSLYGMNRQSHENRMNYNRQVDMWNMTNAYNTPANQMKRYKEAGLNPNLIYGQTNTAQMPNADAGYISSNFDKINMFSNALDGYQNQKDAEATLKRLEEQKAYDRKRQEIIDNRQAKAFEMEMKLKQAQIDNIKSKPFLEAQKNQLKEQNIVEKDAFQSLKSAGKAVGLIGGGGPLSWIFTDAIKKRALGVLAPYSASAVLPALAMGYGFKKWTDFLTSDYVLKKATDFGNKYGYKGTFWSK